MKDSGKFHKLFLNFLEGALSEEEWRDFNNALQSDERLALEFAQYQQVMQIEREIAQQQFVLDEQFTDRVMARISPMPFSIKDVVMKYLRAIGRHFRGQLTIDLFILFGLMAMVWWCYPPVSEPLSGRGAHLGHKYRNLYESVDVFMSSINGVYGAILMLLLLSFSGLFLFFKKFKRAGVFLVMACLTFTSRSLVSTWFNDSSLLGNDDLTVYNDGHPRNSRESIAFEKLGIVQPSPGHPSLGDRSSGNSATVQNSEPIPSSSDLVLGGQRLAMHEKDRNIETFGGLWEPEEQTGERYGDFKESQLVFTNQEPRSTFSIDVDTGSYTNSRRYIRLGQLPPPHAVRVEEFLNYFDYRYADSADGSPFAASFEIASAIDGSGKYLLKIGVKAQSSQARDVEKPWNLVFLVDTSGSMESSDKLPLVKQSLSLLVDKMRAGDTLSIVTYAGSSQVLLPPTTVAEKGEILRRIANLSSGGSTAGAAGIVDAYRLAERTFNRNGVNRVILATDGDFNVGISNTDELVRLIEEKRKTGITLTTLGFGTGNLNEAMMEQLANKGDGNYFYIDSFSEARKVLEEELYGTIEVVAKDVKIQIEFNPARVLQYRLIGYDNRVLRNEDFANDKIDAGEIGAGHAVTAMYEIVLVGSEAARNLEPDYRYKKGEATAKGETAGEFHNELGFLQIRYKQPEGSESMVKAYPVLENMIVPSFEQASIDFCFASAVQAFAAKLREGQFIPRISYDEIARISKRCKGPDANGRRQEFIELVENVAAIKRESNPPRPR